MLWILSNAPHIDRINFYNELLARGALGFYSGTGVEPRGHDVHWLHMQQIRSSLYRLLILAISISPLFAQTPATPKVTSVMATLTVKPGITQDQIMKVLPAEVRDTVQLYLDGKIQQWYARGDGKGIVFFLDCRTVDEAKAILESLPLAKENLASFEYMPLGPLAPLRLLIAPPNR